MKVDDKIQKSYKEVYRIIEHSSLEVKNKIPKSFINTISELMDQEYEPQIDYSKDINDQNLMKETYAMMALIYRDFICDKNKQKILLDKEKKERIKIEKIKKEKYNPNNLFENSNL